MGKLHYNHRKIEGRKLGQVIAKDLTKRIPPNAGSKAALRDPVVDLDASGKNLADENAIFEVGTALVESLNYSGDQGRVVRLEELCLKGCGLTIVSLQALTPVILLAANDLRDLDLSGNGITINTEDDIAIWEDFLTAFEDCCVLRRLDFSGNALGVRAFEVLTRVYAKENPVDLLLSAGDEEAGEQEPEDASKDMTGLREGLRKVRVGADIPETGPAEGSKRRASKQEPKSPTKTGLLTVHTGPLPIHITTQGLRSVPYLIFTDTEMTETCALHLSYVISSHYTPEKLLARVPGAKAGAPAQQLATYDNESGCQGIIHQPNPSLSKAGLKVLELAEAVREEESEEATDDDPQTLPTHPKTGKNARRASEAQATALTVTTGRRRRARTSGGPDDTTKLALQRARTRAQVNTLEEAGPHSNELWHKSLKLLCFGRQIQPQGDHNPFLAEPASEPPPPPPKPIVRTLDVPGGKKRAKKLTPHPPMTTFQLDTTPAVAPFYSWEFPKMAGPAQPLPQHHSLQPPPGLSVPEISYSEAQPETHEPSFWSKVPPEINIINPTPAPSVASDDHSDHPPPPHAPQYTPNYRTDLPCGFSEKVWTSIMGYALDAKDIMSARQQEQMMSWAMDRQTLWRETENLGQTVAGQIWRVLDGAGCLAYDIIV